MSRRFYIRVDQIEFSDRWQKALPEEPKLLVYQVDGVIEVGGDRHSTGDMFEERERKPKVLALYMTSTLWGPRVKLDDTAKKFKVSLDVQEFSSGATDKCVGEFDLPFETLKPVKVTLDADGGGFTATIQVIPDFIGRRVYTGIKAARTVPDATAYNAVGTPSKVYLRAAIWAPKTSMDSSRATNALIESKYGSVPPEWQERFSQEPKDVIAEHPYLRAKFLLDTIMAAEDVCARRFKAEYDEVQRKGEQVLHLFLGPEWYFRRGNRPYPQHDMINVLNLLNELLTKDDSYKPCRKWLIMPGTIYWGMQMEQTGRSRWFVFNTLPIYWQGSFFTYLKRNEADIDSSLKKSGAEIWGQYAELQVGRARLAAASKDTVYSVGGFRFGVEVCRDHAMGRLVRDWGNDPDSGIDVHVVTANDVQPDSWKKVPKDGGLFVYCDGNKGMRALWRVGRNTTHPKATEYEARRRALATKFHAFATLEDEKRENESAKTYKQERVDKDKALSSSEKSKLKAEIKAHEKRIGEITAATVPMQEFMTALNDFKPLIRDEAVQPVFVDPNFLLSIFGLEEI